MNVHAFRWKAVYKVIPDERDLIESTLKQMVCPPSYTALAHSSRRSLTLALIALLQVLLSSTQDQAGCLSDFVFR